MYIIGSDLVVVAIEPLFLIPWMDICGFVVAFPHACEPIVVIKPFISSLQYSLAFSLSFYIFVISTIILSMSIHSQYVYGSAVFSETVHARCLNFFCRSKTY